MAILTGTPKSGLRRANPGTTVAPIAATWDPLNVGSGIILSSGNTLATKPGGGGWTTVKGLQGASSGDRYFEITVTGTIGDVMIGVADAGASLALYTGNPNAAAQQSAGAWGGGGRLYRNFNGFSEGASGVTAGVIGVRFNFTTKTITIYLNGVMDSTYTEPGTVNELFPAASLQNTGGDALLNSAGPFSFQPSGTVAWGS